MNQTLLIVSDSASLIRMLGITLNGAGYESVASCPAVDALAWLSTGKAQLVVIDMDMQHGDGLALVAEIRRIPTCKFTPVIMLAVQVNKSFERRGLEMGVRHWVVKPFQPWHLLAVVSCLMLA